MHCLHQRHTPSRSQHWTVNTCPSLLKQSIQSNTLQNAEPKTSWCLLTLRQDVSGIDRAPEYRLTRNAVTGNAKRFLPQAAADRSFPESGRLLQRFTFHFYPFLIFCIIFFTFYSISSQAKLLMTASTTPRHSRLSLLPFSCHCTVLHWHESIKLRKTSCLIFPCQESNSRPLHERPMCYPVIHKDIPLVEL